MKNIFKLISGIIGAVIKKITGKSNDVIVQLPENVAITPAEVDQVIAIVNQVKSVVDNPVTVLLTDLIPTTIDNDIRERVSAAIGPVTAGLTFLTEWQQANADHQKLTETALASVRFSDDASKNAFYHSLAARLIIIVSDGKVTWSEAVSFIEVYFKQAFIIK
jgi:hypothetical protein